ncbi:monalysin family beta-barrel pore-forming toxin [Sorangium sp. So ce134]
MNERDLKEGAMPFGSIREMRAAHKKVPAPKNTLSNFVSDTYPWAEGNFQIDNYLKSLNPQKACWLIGDTVYGPVYIGDETWGTYTRPIFAYLEYVDRYPLPNGETVTHNFVQRAGFTSSFTESVNVGYSVSDQIDLVNVTSNINVGFSATQAWSKETEESWTVALQGPGTFYAYQIVLVYAHRATMLGNKYPHAFKYQRQNQVNSHRMDIYYLSAIHMKDEIAITNPITPLTWDQVQQYVLIDHWNDWYFDYSAYDNNRYG